jgi:tRNA dimethylallyltransferase
MSAAYPTGLTANTTWETAGMTPTTQPGPDRRPVVAVVGPTAAGKSELSLDLAQALGGEVVNTDSMQVYRGMDIGTAKLPVDERRGIPHHLLDLLEVTEPATVAEFQGWARDVIADCRARGVIPVLVGGSALYTRAVLDRFEFPGTDPAVRHQLEQELAEVGPEAMHRRLAAVDADAAARIIATNGRRVVRALEVIAITGRPFSATLPELRYAIDDAHQIGVDIPREVLDERIARRVERMWEAGFVDEVRRLAERGLREGRTANRALGYQQVLAFLDGELTEEEAKEQTVAGTRRFARRQDSWFRKDPRISWVGWDDPDRVEKAVAVIGQPAAR